MGNMKQEIPLVFKNFKIKIQIINVPFDIHVLFSNNRKAIVSLWLDNDNS